MTTIAYREGQIAYDSQATRGETIVNTPFNKKIEANGYKFFYSGSPNNIEYFVESFFSGCASKEELNLAAFVVTPDGEVLLAAVDSTNTVSIDGMSDGEHYAIGSGYEYAIGAMDAGCTAKEAVKIAANRDIYTGGRIRTFNV